MAFQTLSALRRWSGTWAGVCGSAVALLLHQGAVFALKVFLPPNEAGTGQHLGRQPALSLSLCFPATPLQALVSPQQPPSSEPPPSPCPRPTQCQSSQSSRSRSPCCLKSRLPGAMWSHAGVGSGEQPLGCAAPGHVLFPLRVSRAPFFLSSSVTFIVSRSVRLSLSSLGTLIPTDATLEVGSIFLLSAPTGRQLWAPLGMFRTAQSRPEGRLPRRERPSSPIHQRLTSATA